MRVDFSEFWQIARLLLSGLPQVVIAFLIHKITFNKLRECPVFYERPERRISGQGKTYLTHLGFRFIRLGSKGGVRGLGQWEETTSPDVTTLGLNFNGRFGSFPRTLLLSLLEKYNSCSLLHQP